MRVGLALWLGVLAALPCAAQDRWQVTLNSGKTFWDLGLVKLAGDTLVVRHGDSTYAFSLVELDEVRLVQKSTRHITPEPRRYGGVLGGSAERRGVVTSASYEARAYGVHSAMPMARAVRLCPSATVVPVPWEACARKSREIRDVLRRFTPAVEQASSDEFYVDLTGTDELYRGEPL